jgi:hypothetical protein
MQPRTRNDADTPVQSWVQRRKPGFFFWLNLVYLVVLLLLPLFRAADFLFLHRIEDPVGDVIPIGVPWFGALGAILISLYGVWDHNQEWDPKWNYWHMARPIAGVALGTIAYLIFIGVINATGATPTTSATPDGATEAAPTPQNLIPYYVIAFLVGFREETFRDLIRRATDVLLGPGTGGTPTAAVAVSPSPIRFDRTPVGQASEVLVSVRNTGTGNLVVGAPSADPPGTGIEGAVFSIREDTVAGATIAPNGSSTLEVVFRPDASGEHRGVLRISTSVGTHVVPILGLGA